MFPRNGPRALSSLYAFPPPPGAAGATEGQILSSLPSAQILKLKIHRLEHLLQLKNVRIDNLSRKLQQAEQKQK